MARGPSPSEPFPIAPKSELASTRTLLLRIRAGDDSAREVLFERLLPGLRRWAHGRLPPRVRGPRDTDDLVQTSLVRAFQRLDRFEARRDGAFLAYVHEILLNCIRDELRRTDRRPAPELLPDDYPDDRIAWLDRELGPGVVETYEAALQQLPEEQQQAVILRLEFGFSYREMATALARPTPNAARMLYVRGLARLARGMDAIRR